MKADEIFQQELFADCARHASDTTWEAEGAQVVFRLNMLIKTSPFPGQRTEILKWLDTFLQSPVYADVANSVLNSLIINHALPDTLTTIQAVLTLFNRTPQRKTSELQPVYQQLLELALEESFSFEQMITAARLLREGGLLASIKQHALSIMLSLAQEPQLPPAQVIDAIWTICDNTTSRSKIRTEAYQLLLRLIQRPDLSMTDATEAADALYNLSPDASLEKQQAIQLLLDLSQRRDIPFGDAVQAAFVLHGNSPEGSEEHRQIVQTFIALVQRPDLTFEQAIQINYIFNRKPLRSKQYLAFQMLFTLAQRPELTIDEAEKLAQVLYERCQLGAKAARNVPFDQFLLHSVTAILKNTAAPYWEKEQAVNMLMQMVNKEVARSYLKLRWKPSKSDKTDPPGVLALVELVREDTLPLEIRDEMYRLLRRASSPV